MKELPKSEKPRTALTWGAPSRAVTMGYVTCSSTRSGLRSQLEYTMTCVSLISGTASRAICFMDHHPAKQATATMAKIRNLFFTEKSITRLTMPPPGMRNDAGWRDRLHLASRPALFELILRLPACSRVHLRAFGRRVCLCRFFQAAFRADKKIACNHNSLARPQPVHDLYPVIQAPSGFHRAR